MVTDPDRAPSAVGANVIEIVQVPPPGTDEPHVFVCEKSGDDDVMLAIEIAPDELFLSDTATGALVCPSAAEAKVTLMGVKLVGANPVPVTLRICGLSAALSIMVIFPERAPLADGAKITVIVQLAPEVNDAPQVLACANSVDDEVMLAMEMAAEVLFLNEVGSEALVFPMAVAGNASVAGERVVGAAPVPLIEISFGLSAPLWVMVIVPDRAPTAVGAKLIEIVQLAPTATEDPQVLL
jgi:hypothetical protein